MRRYKLPQQRRKRIYEPKRGQKRNNMKKYRITQARYTDTSGMEHKVNLSLTFPDMESIENYRKGCAERCNATNMRFTYEEREEE